MRRIGNSRIGRRALVAACAAALSSAGPAGQEPPSEVGGLPGLFRVGDVFGGASRDTLSVDLHEDWLTPAGTGG